MAIVGLLCAALAAAQVLLPRVAEGRIRANLGEQSTGLKVDVHASPAIKMLLGKVDRVKIRADELRADDSPSAPPVDELLSRAGAISQLDVRIGEVQAPAGVRVRDVAVRKDGDAISVRAGLDLARLKAVMPAGIDLKPLPAPDGEIRLGGSASPFGEKIGAGVRLIARDGAVVMQPEGLPFASLVSVPVFSSDRISVDGLGASPAGDGLDVSVRAHLLDR